MIGTDIVKIERIAKIAKKERIFAVKEIEYANSFKDKLERYAGFFACKEALFKACSKDEQKKIRFNEVCVCHTDEGKPYFEFYGETANVLSSEMFEVSISHDGEYVVAFVIKKI